jgi:phosphonoacetaldehyde hydrolase
VEKEAHLSRAREELRAAGAHYVIDSIGELIPVLDDIDERLHGTR